ncbi:MAG: selenoneine synthase SenA [Burkholderiales bacterium]
MTSVIQASPACNLLPQGQAMRHADPARIAVALTESRAELLAMWGGFERTLGAGGLRIGYDPVLNLPLWELGHIGWFEEWWIARNRDRARGIHYDAALARAPSLLPGSDALYDSANVEHTRRWQLDLPGADETRGYLSDVRDATLALLTQSRSDDDALYFFRLVLFHDAMHREAWRMMAQHLGIDLGLGITHPVAHERVADSQWQVPGGLRRIGASGGGFAFDNELKAHEQVVESFGIDRAVVPWRRYLPFIEAGGYDDERLWPFDGWQWRKQHSNGMPLHLRRSGDGWQQHRFGRWLPIELDAPALHLTAHEAAAWCRFAGRRLPTEFEWETAAVLAMELREPFDWGRVWEWTASPHAPYPGFMAHPYREYSAPFFDGRPVLRGGSWATDPILLHPRYRNYFSANRADVYAGLRSCTAS